MESMEDLVKYLTDENAWDIPLNIRLNALLEHMRRVENSVTYQLFIGSQFNALMAPSLQRRYFFNEKRCDKQ